MGAKQTPRRVTGGQRVSAGSDSGIRVTRQLSGCPCGCRTRPPWGDDPDCVRHQPLPPVRDWPHYDVITLGLVPHPRENCPACQAVGV